MTIYLLDGCSADYDINKSNFSKPSLALEKLHTDFLIWIFTTTGNTPTRPKNTGSWETRLRGGGVFSERRVGDSLALKHSLSE